MKKIAEYDPNLQVSGDSLLLFIDALGAYREIALLKLREKGLDLPKQGSWYSLGGWIEILTEISEHSGENVLYGAGRTLAFNTAYFGKARTLKKALESIDVVYHTNHRGGEAGYYKVKMFDRFDRFARLECRNPYPVEFNRGIITMVADWYNEENTVVSVELDEAGYEEGRFYYNVFW